MSHTITPVPRAAGEATQRQQAAAGETEKIPKSGAPWQAAIDAFRGALKGRLIERSDDAYDAARQVYNAAVDKRPMFIVKCADASDVLESVNFARANSIEVAVKGGGHSAAGFALVDNGLVIDLSAMRNVTVNYARRTVNVQAGCTWSEVDRATHTFGLAVPSGIVSTTGVGGLTLGGGQGYLTRKFGLTIDNLLSATVVLANGQVVRASAADNPDLFWALRGGGGNFGIVTDFEFRAHHVDMVIGGPMLWPIESLDKAISWYRDWISRSSENAYAFFAIMTVPNGAPFPYEARDRKACGVVWCFTGQKDEANSVTAEAKSRVGEPLVELVGLMPFPSLQSMHDALLPPGLQWYWKGSFLEDIPPQAVAIHQCFANSLPSALSTMHIYPIDGAAHHTAANATAWSGRQAKFSMIIAGMDPAPAKLPALISWVRSYWSALQPYTSPCGYVNFMPDEGSDRVREIYDAAHFERLREVKAKYDPRNFFHVNQNIKP